MTGTILQDELKRREYCVKFLRGGDMGEQATNYLMERLSKNPGLLGHASSLSQEFAIQEYNDKNITVFTTEIGMLRISDVMCARLRTLYNLHNIPKLITPLYLSNFSRAVFLLLYRYEYIDPGFRRQSFLGPRYFEAIEDAFGMSIDLEAFASAFNTTVSRYCSMFPDIEKPFGSFGSFFDLDNVDNMFLIQVSPPRVGDIIENAVKHCIKLLQEAKHGVYFIVLTPYAWTDISDKIDRSGYCVWRNRTRKGDTIEYHDVIRNLPRPYAMPRVSILSRRRITQKASGILHKTFSSF